MAHSEALPIVDHLMPQLASYLVDDSDVLYIASATNAYVWGLDDYDDLKAWFEGYGKIKFSVNIFLEGDQDQDKPFCGSQISVQLEGKLIHEDNWKIDNYDILEIKLNDF